MSLDAARRSACATVGGLTIRRRMPSCPTVFGELLPGGRNKVTGHTRRWLVGWDSARQVHELFRGQFMRAIVIILLACAAWGEPVTVRQVEGSLHGFLVLRSPEGSVIADGELTQITRAGHITSRLVFRFKDGSVQDETTVFSQAGHFRVLTDHLVQKGPVFKRPMDVSINGSTGLVTVRFKDDKGNDKVETATMKLPLDLANGMIPVLLKNLAPGAASTTVSMVVATPKPLLVKLVISSEGDEAFTTGGASHTATRYDIKVDIGGVRGVLAPIVGKQPPDTHVWMLGGSSPAFVKSEGPSFEGGPSWLTELVSPVWPKGATTSASTKK
jgi:hypothetical protein